LESKSYAALVYGIGADYYVNRRFGFTYDLRGFRSMPASFGLPQSPVGPGLGAGTLWVARNRDESTLAFTAGVSFRFGYHEPPPPPAPRVEVVPPPPPPPTVITVSAIQGAHDVCPGDNIRLTVSAQGWAQGQTPVYQWTINNQPAPGGRGPAFNLPTTDGSGQKAIRVTVNAGGATASAGPVNVLVRNLAPPTIRFAVNPTTIAYGDRLPLNAQATVSECATATPIRYAADQGTINGNAFDSSTLTFDPNGAGLQQKVVRLTATETDSKNGTANANANVTVTFRVPASRQDIVFPDRSARVNNAAKRYLIEVLTPKLRADPNSKVILIGHRDMSETGRAAATLDTQRVLNTAAVLSAGKGICPQLDLSRVQVKYDGTDQTDPPMPFADASVKERGGQSATDQRAQFRRVEIWFVPGGADTPAGITGLQPAPAQLIQAKGCPR
jgi:outer membrane protein OmpA-like peptidoglycan-associated protein